MAIRKKSATAEPKQPTELLTSRDEAESKLQERIHKGRDIKQIQITSLDALDTARNEYNKWNSFNTELLKRMFTTEELAGEYSQWYGGIFISRGEPSLREKISDLFRDIDDKIHRLDSILERLVLIPLNNQHAVSETEQVSPKSSSAKSKKYLLFMDMMIKQKLI
ncbi:hypothetical protein ACSZMZ_00470 [Aeromonas veronii]